MKFKIDKILLFAICFVFAVFSVILGSIISKADGYYYEISEPYFLQINNMYQYNNYFCQYEFISDTVSVVGSYCAILDDNASTDELQAYRIYEYDYEHNEFFGRELGYTRKIVYADGTVTHDNGTVLFLYEGTESNAPYRSHYELTTNIPLFTTRDSASNFMVYGDNSGQINRPDIDITESGVYDENIPIPKLVPYDPTLDSHVFRIENASEDLNIELQGRWYSVDDIELYKENLMWKYKYDTLLKGDLKTWVSYKDFFNSTNDLDADTLGDSAWQEFLAQYPVDNRTYLGGTNAIGNFLFGYNDALDTLKNMHLSHNGGLFTGIELYVRFWYEDENGIHYGRWNHYYDEMAKPTGSTGTYWDSEEDANKHYQSDVGLTDSEKENIESTGNSKTDIDAIPNIQTEYETWEDGISSVTTLFDSMIESVGGFSRWVSSLFGFLPNWCIAIIGIGLVFCIILRIGGR